MAEIRLTRKGLLQGAGAAALAAGLPGGAFMRTAAAKPRGRRQPKLAPEAQVWEWQQQLAEWSPPWPGTPGHRSFVDWIDSEFQAAGLESQRRSLTFDYWDLPSRFGLTAKGEEIPVATYQHYSGPTGPEGVTGPLAYVGASTALASLAGGLAGKIVVFELPAAPLPAAMYERLGVYPADAEAEAPAAEINPAATFLTSFAPRAQEAAGLGAIGAIFAWGPEFSDEAVMHQNPHWLAGPLEIPALFVGNTTRKRLVELAGASTPVTLTLESSITPDHTSDNVWAVLPGQSDEVITINTHSDGCNAYEENGGIAVATMARYFAQLPIEQRNRTLVFAATTGHFGHGLLPGTSTFHEEEADLFERTVAAVTAEHLGGNEWVDEQPIGLDGASGYAPTGAYHWDWVYCRPGRAMADVLLGACDGTEFKRAEAVRPYANQAGIQFGEGSEYAGAGKAVIATLGHAWYLFTQPPHGELDKISRERMYGEITALTRSVEALDKMPAEAMLEE